MVRDPVVELVASIANGRMVHGRYGSGHYLLPTWIMSGIALKPNMG
jgi:hypothetical protein